VSGVVQQGFGLVLQVPLHPVVSTQAAAIPQNHFFHPIAFLRQAAYRGTGVGSVVIRSVAMLDGLAFVVAVILSLLGIAGVPSWSHPLKDACELATLLGGLTLVVLFATRFMGRFGVAFERQWLAVFLAGMPVVYLASWLASTSSTRHVTWFWLGIELFGLVMFGTLALLGLMRSAWYLVVGIALHGLAWDSWHYLADAQEWTSGPTYVPAWYARGCLLVDVGIALYLAARLWSGRDARRISAGSPP
jgi:hypothetical protein